MKQSKKIEQNQITSPGIENQDGILFFLPMLFVAWSDCVLGPTETDLIRERISSQTWLRPVEKNTLLGWVDPSNPPSPLELRRWLRIIKNAGNEIPEDARQSLVNLGVEIARVGSKEADQRCNTPQACAALVDAFSIPDDLLGAPIALKINKG